MLIVGLAVAGAIGAPTRFLLDGYVQDKTSGEQPLGTLVINVTGSLVLGFLTGLVLYTAFPPPPTPAPDTATDTPSMSSDALLDSVFPW